MTKVYAHVTGASTSAAGKQVKWHIRFYRTTIPNVDGMLEELSTVEFDDDGREIPLAGLEIGSHEWNMVTASNNTIRLKVPPDIMVQEIGKDTQRKLTRKGTHYDELA